MWNCWPQIQQKFNLWIKIWIYILNIVLNILTPHFIQASCKKHDEGYKKWWTEDDRFNCDTKFHYYICRDIEKAKVNIFKKIILYNLASIFYIAVRIWGKVCFNYK